MQIVTLFNHKGGVAKTTNVFNLAWKLAEQGSRVVLVDADSQCNLTGISIGLMPVESASVQSGTDDPSFSVDDSNDTVNQFKQFQDRSREFWDSVESNNIHSALRPVFMAEPRPLEAPACIPIEGNENLFLLPGSLNLADYESDLSVAQSLQGAFGSQRNLPGAIYKLLTLVAEKYDADYVVVDLSPSLGAINQNIVSISDQIIIPCSPDYFSVMALRSLASILPRWKRWAEEAASKPQLKEATYRFPGARFKFAGIVVSRYVIYKKEPASAFRQWIAEVQQTCKENLVPALRATGSLHPDSVYEGVDIDSDYTLAKVREFNSLRPRSQLHQVPPFALSSEQIGLAGIALTNAVDQVNELNSVYNVFADRIRALSGTGA